MANTIRFANATRDAMLDAITTAIGNAGIIEIYTGTTPATPDTAIGAQVKLGTLTFASPPAPGASTTSDIWTAGQSSYLITQDSGADATGTAAWARILKANGTTKVFDCDVATSGGVINLNTLSIVTGGPIQITSFTITLP